MLLSIDLKGSTATPHQRFQDTGNTTMVDTTAFPSTGATTIADTSRTATGGMATIATAGTPTLPRIGDGSSVGNIAPAIPDSIMARG